MSDDHKFNYYGNNRTLCQVLEDMRGLDKSKNYSALNGLIEEAQAMANRMEAGLYDQKDLIQLQKDHSKARKAYKALEEEYDELLKKAKPLRAKSKPEK